MTILICFLMLLVAINTIGCDSNEILEPTPTPTTKPIIAPIVITPRPTLPYTPYPKYTQEEITYFLTIAFGFEALEPGEPFNKVAKWDTFRYITISLEGNYNIDDVVTVRRVIGDINEITQGQLTLQHVDKEGMIIISFVPTNTIRQYLPPQLSSHITHGHGSLTTIPFNNEIIGVNIQIANDVSQERRNHVIREEMTQALGLRSDSLMNVNSIFYGEFSNVQEYADIDRIVIEILYLTDIRPGMTLDQVKEVLSPYAIK